MTSPRPSLTHGSRGRLAVAAVASSSALVLAAVGAVGGATAPSAAAQAPASPAVSSVAACVPETARVRGGGDGHDPNSLPRAEAIAADRAVSARVRSRRLAGRSLSIRATVTIDVHVHVLQRNNGTGGATGSQIRRQIAVLNQAFAGRTAAASAPTIFRFAIRSVDYTRNSDWYNWSPDNDNDDARAKSALHRGGLDDLNLYLANLSDDLLGYATFPWDTTVARDGVVLLNDALPGGSAAPYNRGDTATHEVGHWLGLYHTFQNGCTAPGDRVSDTPYQRNGNNIYFCRESDDTCRQPGRDPVHNFMSYGDDPCLNRFSTGQARRMDRVWFAFRSSADLLP